MLGHTDVPSDGFFQDCFNEGYYYYAYPKYDGIRCLINDAGIPLTRKLKEIPNVWVRRMLENHAPSYSDGELILGPEAGFHDVQSAIMTRIGQPDFRYMVFDSFQYPDICFCERTQIHAKHWDGSNKDRYIQFVEPKVITDFATLQSYEQEMVDAGHEGIILRNPYQTYKFGRSTLSERGMLKIKRFLDDEAEIIGFEEKMLNKNDPEINRLGLQERKHGIDGKVGAGTLGAFICLHPKFGTFNVGTGWTHAFGRYVWQNQLEFLHEQLSFIYQPYGVVNKPRCPRFKGIRKD